MAANLPTTLIKPLPDAAERPTLDIPEAGAYFGLNRLQSYRAAKDGFLPTVRVSARRYKVPVATLRSMLGLSAGGDAA